MATVLTHAIIEGAKGTVDTYISTAIGLYQELESAITTLTGSNFSGDASDGYKAFFAEKAKPALTENLTDANTSLMASIKGILESIETQLLDTVDPQLGDNNRDPGAAE